MTALPPPGWFPDPEAGGTRWRWWDGTQWAPPGYGYAPAPDPVAHARALEMHAESTRRVGQWFRWVIAALGAGIVSWSIALAFLFNGTVHNGGPDTTDEHTPRSFIVVLVLWGLFGVVSWAYQGLYIAWLYQAGKYADVQGWPARRGRSLGAFSVLIPVLNLWWPYEAICDLYVPGARPDAALWWFIAQLVIAPLTLMIVGFTALVAPAAVVGAAVGVCAVMTGATIVLGWRMIDHLDAMQRAHLAPAA